MPVIDLVRGSIALVKKIWLFTLAGGLASACATVEVTPDRAKPARAEMLFSYQTAVPEKTATLIVTRDRGKMASVCPLSLHIDKKLAAQLNSSETARFFLDPGEHVVKINWSKLAKGPCALARNAGATREIVLAANESKSFRLMIGASGVMDIVRSDY